MNFMPVMYTYAHNRAARAFTGLTKTDFNVLYKLYALNYPVSFTVLFDSMSADCANTTNETFCTNLYRLAEQGAVSKTNPLSNRTSYTITSYGRLLLAQYNIVLEQIVKEMICKYADDHGL